MTLQFPITVTEELFDEMKGELGRLRTFAMRVIRSELDEPSEGGEQIMEWAVEAELVEIITHATPEEAAACEYCGEWGGEWHYSLAEVS